MITKQEIMDFAKEFGLSPNIVEKDYVLGWILSGISQKFELSENWLFKGGTCLKKCFFETYRFSEDLDFTLINPEQINNDFLLETFRELADNVYENSGIQIPKDKIYFDIFKNPRGKISAQGKLSYKGPMQPGGNLPCIKLDLTADEILVLDPVARDVHHPYTDRPEQGFTINCYCFEELFAEKIRALGERLRPRDLYDVVNLYRQEVINPNRSLILKTLDKKCKFKNVPIPTLEKLSDKPERIELVSEWANMLAHQLPALPPFEQFWQELPIIFDWLNNFIEKPAVLSISTEGSIIDDLWRKPAMAQAWHENVPFEAIRFAAANRLCVNLLYNGKWRLIEPYSLRKTKDGNLLLYAVKHITMEDRSYRIDKIQNAQVTNEPFKPKYAIELTASGAFSAPQRYNLKRLKSSVGTTYIIKCCLCGKQFRRSHYSTILNKHKDKNGDPCSGRNGKIIDSK